MRRYLLAVIFLFGAANSYADCPYTFSCTPQGCSRVSDAGCTIPTPRMPDQEVDGHLNNSKGAIFVVPQSSNSGDSRNSLSGQDDSKSTNVPSPVRSCAENGSCYGDISTVNGMPKTNHVNGYFRKDGTYVRGHYRSRGR